MKKSLAMLLALMAMAASACAEDALLLPPAGAEQMDGGWTLPSGEAVELTLDELGAPVSLITVTAAEFDAAGEQSLEGAEEAVRLEYSDALVLASEILTDGSRAVSVLTENLSGTVTVAGDGIVSRELRFGEYISDGRLTMDGARAALLLLRPNAEIAEIEPDEDDGTLIYEGEARMDGAEYEFEMNAKTGKLMEWERD